jgi:hypothetical protein
MNGADLGKSAEIDRNWERFMELLPALMGEHAGDYVLMKDRSVIGYYKSALDAQIAGNQQFEDQIFSIQHIAQAPEELGRYSYAILSRHP